MQKCRTMELSDYRAVGVLIRTQCKHEYCSMVAYFCHHLSDNYVDLSDLFVVLSDPYVDLSDHYVDLSLIHLLENES